MRKAAERVAAKNSEEKRKAQAGRRFLAALAGLAAAFSLAGCSLGADVEGLMRPPRSTGEQEAIQSALEDDLGGASGYTLKYPKSGEYRSAFIFRDLNGDGEKEALAFYQPGGETRNIHINMLQKVEGEWISISDTEGASTDVEEVFFGDLDADGIQEVVVGWNIYNVSDRQLTLYSLIGGQFTKWYEGLYSALLITDLTADSRDDLLVLQTDATGEGPHASLWSAVRGEGGETVLSELGTASLDSTIQQFRSLQTGALSGTLTGVFVDAVRSSGGLVTELLYWDGKRLFAPLHDESTGLTQLTYRDTAIPSMDVDGDGQVEWPSCQAFAGTEEAGADAPLKTDWMGWDYESGTASRKFSSVVNLRDGYLLRLDDAWEGRLTAAYDKEESVLSLYDITGEKKEILALRTIPAVRRTSAASTTASATTTAATGTQPASSGTGGQAGESTEAAGAENAADSMDTASGGAWTQEKERRFFQRLEGREDGTVYEVWFTTQEPYQLSMEYIRYMFIFLN